MEYFSQNYFEARNKFNEAGRQAGASAHFTLKISARGPAGEDLSTDIAILGDPGRAAKLLLHTSGIHGVEGFAGSAVQLAFLNAPVELPRDVCLVLVHVLNPYGMAWLRRVNENNVDLNRNFLAPGEAYAGADPRYRTLDSFLNPSTKPFWFCPPLLWHLASLGFDAVKIAVTQGQYEIAKGLFYGGSRLEEGPQLYKKWLKDNVQPQPRIVLALDVHTGLGPYGSETLFCHTNGEIPEMGRRITALNEPVGYKVRGGLESLTGELFSGAHWAHFTQEFGTRSMAAVLKTLREENWHFHQRRQRGTASERLREVASPSSTEWQSAVVTQGVATLKAALSWLGRS